MKGIMLCSVDGNYHGIVRSNPLGEYLEHQKIGSAVKSFFNYSVDEETQTINYSLTNIDECKKIAKLLDSCGEKCETIIYCTCDENVDFSDSVFLGYDVCSTQIDDSPLALGLIKLPANDTDYYIDFYKSLDAYELKDYYDDLNKFGLFCTYSTALRLSKRSHDVSKSFDDVFYEPSNFEPYKVYLIR